MSKCVGISKSILAGQYKMSSDTLRRLLNEKYYDELTAIGYDKTCRLLPPKVVKRFHELYGEFE